MKSHKHWKYFYELKTKEWFIMLMKVDDEGVAHIFMKIDHRDGDNRQAIDIFNGSITDIDPNEHVIKLIAGNMR